MIDRYVGIYGKRPLMNLLKLWGVKDDPPTPGNRLVHVLGDRVVTVSEADVKSVYGTVDYLVEESVN